MRARKRCPDVVCVRIRIGSWQGTTMQMWAEPHVRQRKVTEMFNGGSACVVEGPMLHDFPQHSSGKEYG